MPASLGSAVWVVLNPRMATDGSVPAQQDAVSYVPFAAVAPFEAVVNC